MRPRFMVNALVVAILCFGTAFQGWTQGEPAQTQNPVPNPSFEEPGRRERPAGWRSQTWGGQAEYEWASVGHTGEKSVKISSTQGADASWSAKFSVEPFAKYRLSCWIKTDNLVATTGKGALINVQDMGEKGVSPVVTGTQDWTKVEVVIDTGSMDGIMLNCLYGGWGFATGTAWYDDVNLELLEKVELKPQAIVEAGKKKEPISKFIYGQFIEHLGRCIYGGIWAEMLQDRKFFYGVGAGESPWKVVGPGEGVKMEAKEDSYVGEHSPIIDLMGYGGTLYLIGGVGEHSPIIDLMGEEPGGISQGGLGLIAGKEYIGRIVLGGDPEAAPIEVSLVWGTGEKDRNTQVIKKIGNEFAKYPLRFKSGSTTDDGRIEIVSRGKEGSFLVGTVSLMPADNVKGFRKDTLALLKELNAPVYRWPGGNFVSGYNWKDGIGDPDKRPPRKNPAWSGVEHNDVGVHEYMEFCRLLDTEPFIAINTGLGTVEAAREQVEYVIGATDTPMGKLRAENGHPEPFKCKFWAVGNEMFGGWQLGHMPVEEYVKKHSEVAKAMWSVDPSIQLVAVGAAGGWDEMILSNCADYMNLLSEHVYWQERPGLMAHIAQATSSIKNVADAERGYRKTISALEGKDIRIAMDEWNYWYGPHLYGELGVRYFLKDGLGVAAALHEFFRNSDIYYMANYAQTVNVIGCIKTSKTEAEFETTGLVLKLYRAEYGQIPVEIAGTPVPLDVAAAWTQDGKALTVGIVNPLDKKVDMPVEFKDVHLSGSGKRWVITGPDPMSYNEPGKKRQVDIVESAVGGVSNSLEVPPISVTLYRLEVK